MGVLATSGNARTRKRYADLRAVASFVDPTSLPNLYAWYDASNAGSISATGSSVDTWNDLSGNGLHLTSSGGARPLTGTRTINSLNVLDFQGAANIARTSGISLGVSTFTLFVVGGQDTNVDNTGMVIACQSTGNDYDNANSFAIETSVGTVQLALTCNSAGPQFAGSGATPIGTWSVRKSTSASQCDIKAPGGTSATGTATSSGTATGRLMIGARFTGSVSNQIDGPIAEVVIYTDRKSDADRDTVRSYLIAKWGV